jgi:anthranilate phosphoribosyltransferase
VSGSSDVMEYFGHKFTDDNSKLNFSLEKSGVCFLHAPLFHPALKRVAPVRRDFGMKTFFNMLGPLVNPAQPGYRVTGVFGLELGRAYHYLFQSTGEKYMVLYGLDGYDELSLTGDAKLFSNEGEEIFSPHKNGFDKFHASDILGGSTVEEAAKIFSGVLHNRGTKAQEEVVLANSALALKCLGKYESMEDAVPAARESLRSGKALQSFKNLLEIK